MLIAHAPAGYIVAKTMRQRSPASYALCSVVFSVWPDLDLLYFYFFAHGKTFHHTYFTHLPLAVLGSFLLTLPLLRLTGLRKFKGIYLFFFVNWALHLLLDTVNGGIMWLYPFSKRLFTFITVPPHYSHWIISFVLHWSFLIELAIVAWAITLLLKTRKKSGSG
jgi:inner membrane protein